MRNARLTTMHAMVASGTIAVFALVLPQPAVSDETATIEEIVLVETRLDDNEFAIGEIISVEADEIDRVQAADAEQLLQRLPGFSVSRPGGPGGVSEVFLRGAESNFTAVYLDGVRLNDPTNTRGGSFDFSFLGAGGIERIDIATGATSAVYGADAMAGVIQIRTAWPEVGTSELAAEYGSTDDWRMGAATSIEVGQDTTLSLRGSSIDGGDEIEGSSLRLQTTATRLAGARTGGEPWQVIVRHAQRERSSFPEVSGGPELAILRDLERGKGDETSVLASTGFSMTESWSSDLSIGAARIRDSSSVPPVAPGVLDGQPAYTTDSGYRRTELLWINRISLPQSIGFVAGANVVSENGTDDGTVDLGFAVLPNAYELDRNVSSLFAEMGRAWGNGWTGTLAGRWDHHGNDGRLSGKVAIERTLTDSGNRIWGRAANGFKLPSFFALGNPLFGNPELTAEKVRNAEIGYTHVFPGGNQWIVSAFRARYENLVDFDFETFTNINRGRIDNEGVELRTNLRLTERVMLRLDGMVSNNSSKSGPLRRRPKRSGGASIDWSISDRWNVIAVARHIGPRLITSIPSGDLTDDAYTIVSATINYERSGRAAFWLAVDNAFDTDYQDAPGFPSPGARVRSGFKLAF
ncbi:MAG: TonB-dependent receptor [Rhodospirillaceae bacterium]|nr:TonB-dependent receptor [Rhodospirillaceae bacterium]